MGESFGGSEAADSVGMVSKATSGPRGLRCPDFGSRKSIQKGEEC